MKPRCKEERLSLRKVVKRNQKKIVKKRLAKTRVDRLMILIS